jgi:hypothetical protein
LLEGFVVVEDQHVRSVAKDYALMRVGSGGERWFKRVRRGHSPYFWCMNGSSRGEVGYILVGESCQLRPWVLGQGMKVWLVDCRAGDLWLPSVSVVVIARSGQPILTRATATARIPN